LGGRKRCGWAHGDLAVQVKTTGVEAGLGVV